MLTRTMPTQTVIYMEIPNDVWSKARHVPVNCRELRELRQRIRVIRVIRGWHPAGERQSQNKSFNANWIWREVVDVAVMTPAEEL